MNLSKYFTLAEVTKTEVRLKNEPLPVVIGRITELCLQLDKVREEFGAIWVTSGYRSAAVNTRVGGSEDSQHVKGEAIDFVPMKDGVTHVEVAGWMAKNLPFDQLILEKCSCLSSGEESCNGWIHYSYVTHRENRYDLKRMRVVRDGKTGRSWKQYVKLDPTKLG